MELDETAPAGTIVDKRAEGIVVACGDGGCALKHVKPAGKREMSVAEWLRGSRLNAKDAQAKFCAEPIVQQQIIKALEAALATPDVQQRLDVAGCEAKSAPLGQTVAHIGFLPTEERS